MDGADSAALIKAFSRIVSNLDVGAQVTPIGEVIQSPNSSGHFAISIESMAPILSEAISLGDAKKAQRAHATCDAILGGVDLFYSTAGRGTVFVDTGRFYQAVKEDTLRQWMIACYSNTVKHKNDWTSKDIADAVQLLKDRITGHNRGAPNKRYIYTMIADLYWDSESGELLNALPNGEHCFRHLFDNPINSATGLPEDPDHGIAFTDDWGPEHAEILRKWYDKAYRDAKENQFANDTVLEEFSFIKGWATDENGVLNHGRYMDIMMSVADIFMGPTKKPMGQISIIGGHGNGKSLYRGMILTIIGKNNLTQINNADLTRPQDVIDDIARGGLLNFPDEEVTNDRGMDSAAQRVFKNIGDHKEVASTVKFSGQKESYAFDMTDIHTLNALPKFTGFGAAACIDRVRPIFFQHNFRAENQGKNGVYRVEKDIFTREAISKLTGMAMGYAKFCLENDIWPESEEMQSHRSAMMEDTDPIEEFASEFNKYFYGAESWAFLEEEAKLWCNDYGKEYDPATLRSNLKMYFPQFASGGKKDSRKRVNITEYNGKQSSIKVLASDKYPNDTRLVLAKKNSVANKMSQCGRTSFDYIHNKEEQSVIAFIESRTDISQKILQQELDVDE